ncbi:MAG: aminotransferase [Gammaproteobacteria bacterium]|nr:aminotransferase [Gammaproteobacteria bacterium]
MAAPCTPERKVLCAGRTCCNLVPHQSSQCSNYCRIGKYYHKISNSYVVPQWIPDGQGRQSFAPEINLQEIDLNHYYGLAYALRYISGETYLSILNGLWTLPWWGYIVVALVLTHITIASVTIFLHRHQTHRALDLHPLVSHFFRFWLWLTTGMITKEWVAIHRKHHARVETDEDPHSPQVLGIYKVLLEGAELYKEEAKNTETLRMYGHETPDDWLERNLYARFNSVGITLMFILDVLLFGFAGMTIWAVQMAWIPFFAAGVINGVGHWGGYRNFESQDASTNIIPWGVLIGGEELHNNHHAFASSAKFSSKWWEFDLGWCYIRFLQGLGFARVKKVAPRPIVDHAKADIDLDTVSAVITNRLYIMSHYAKTVVSRVYKEEKAKANITMKKLLRHGRRCITQAEACMDAKARHRLDELLRHNHAMQVVYEFKQRLQALWTEKTATEESLMHALREWCRQAEATGIEALQEFARSLRSYTLQPV